LNTKLKSFRNEIKNILTFNESQSCLEMIGNQRVVLLSSNELFLKESLFIYVLLSLVNLSIKNLWFKFKCETFRHPWRKTNENRNVAGIDEHQSTWSPSPPSMPSLSSSRAGSTIWYTIYTSLLIWIVHKWRHILNVPNLHCLTKPKHDKMEKESWINLWRHLRIIFTEHWFLFQFCNSLV